MCAGVALVNASLQCCFSLPLLASWMPSCPWATSSRSDPCLISPLTTFGWIALHMRTLCGAGNQEGRKVDQLRAAWVILKKGQLPQLRQLQVAASRIRKQCPFSTQSSRQSRHRAHQQCQKWRHCPRRQVRRPLPHATIPLLSNSMVRQARSAVQPSPSGMPFLCLTQATQCNTVKFESGQVVAGGFRPQAPAAQPVHVQQPASQPQQHPQYNYAHAPPAHGYAPYPVPPQGKQHTMIALNTKGQGHSQP